MQNSYQLRLASIIISLSLASSISLMANPANASSNNNLSKEFINLNQTRVWSKNEIIDLGYEPNEVIIKFKKSFADLKTPHGKNLALETLKEQSNDLANTIVKKLIENGRINQDSATEEKIHKLKQELFKIDRYMAYANICVIKLAIDNSVNETIQELASLPFTEYVAPNYIVVATDTPSESSYSNGQLWGLNNDGSTLAQGPISINGPDYGTNNPDPNNNDPDIQAANAWNIFTGTNSTVVAILDSGIDYAHPDLDGNLWSPAATCYDENGDAILQGCPHHGWDYTNGDDDPKDDYGHGTHVTGIIGASQGDGGTVGVNWNIELMSIKCLDNSGIGNLADCANGINFAKFNGAKIINASFRSTSDWQDFEDAVGNFINNGGIFVASAGNDRNDLGTDPVYPAVYNFNNLITVAATDQADEIWDEGIFGNGSNYGDMEVDLAAPGANILSTYWYYDDGDVSSYKFISGTSMAAPFAAGTVALIWGAYPDLTATEVKQILMDSGDHTSSLEGKTVSENRLNAYRALVMAKQVDNEQVIVLNPTIHSKAAGGNWSTTGTWVEGRVPNSSDVVEINGNVSLDANATIVGLLVNSGFTFKPTSGGDRTLTISGDVVNNGTIQNNTAYLYLNIADELENNGSMTNREVYIDGSLINTSTISQTGPNSTLAGDLVNTGSITSAIKLDGASTQTIDSTGTISGALTLNNNAIFAQNTTIAGTLTVSATKTLTIGGSDTLTANNTLTNNGTITGGGVVLGGGAQSWGGNGTYNIASLTLGGTAAKSLGSNATINGDVTVNSGVTLQPVSSNYTLAVTGDLVNNGTIQNGTPWLYLNISGNLENNGTMSNRTTTVSGNATNSSTGALSMAGTPNNIGGDLTNTGNITAAITLNGVSAQTVSSSSTISSMTVGNNVSVSGNLEAQNLTINSGKTLTIASGNTVSISGTLSSTGTISGGNINLSGGSQNFSMTGTTNVETFTIGGTGTKSHYSNAIVNGDLTVNSGVTLQAAGGDHSLTINGDLVNNGTIQNGTPWLSIYIGSDWDNNGTMNQYRTYADWEPVGGANSYDFQYTNTSDVWQAAVSTGTNTYYNITAYKNDVRKWRWRSVTGGTPSDWSADHLIN